MAETVDAMSITALLHAWTHGDDDALSQLMRQLNGQLMQMAASRLRGAETPSLAVGDLLHEALLRIIDSRTAWRDRAHFFATISTAMRSVLVDHARARRADKRGGAFSRVTFSLSDIGEDSMVADLLTLDAVLRRLSEHDERASQILQFTYFGGLKREDIAAVMNLSVPTVDRELRFARAWLAEQLNRHELEA